MDNKLRVLAVINDNGAVAQIRIISILEFLAKMNFIEHQIIDISEEEAPTLRFVPDIVIMQRLHNIFLLDMIKLLKSKGTKVVFEIDDNLFALPSQNPNHSFYNKPNIKRSMLELIWLADHLIVSTDNLKKYLSRYNKSISVIPNQIDDDIFTNRKLKLTNPDNIRIGFAGTLTHRADFHQVENALFEIKEKFKNKVKLVFINMIPESFIYDQNVEYISGVNDLKRYSDLLINSNLDIGLAPLSFNMFNLGKSDIKFLEYGISGIAGIYSNFGPYRRSVKHNKTGLLVNLESNVGWNKQISYLIENPKEIDKIKSNAFKYVSQSRTISKNYNNWLNVFYSLTKKEGNNLNNKIPNEKSLPKKKSSLKCHNSTEIPQVSVIVPIFNRAENTKKCIESLLKVKAKIKFEIIVVDNASTDESGEIVKQFSKKDHQIKYLRNKENLGFAKANNIGAKIAKGEYLLFLNNDTEITDNFLDYLYEIVSKDELVAAVGAKLLFADGNIQHAGVAVIKDLSHGDPLIAKHIYYKYKNDSPEVNKLMEYQALTAACLLVKKSAFNEVGEYDENYWNGYEDVDLCFKLREKGYKLVYQPKAVVYHYESQSGPERFSKVQHNIDRLHSKWLNKIIPDFEIDEKGNSIKISPSQIKPYAKEEIYSEENNEEYSVSLIVPIFNQLEYTKQFLESLELYNNTNSELIFVDNASTDDSLKYLKGKLSENFRLIENDKNLGFPKAINKGLKRASGKYILIANNDIVVTENWLERMLEVAESDEKIGIVGPISNAVSGVQLDKDAKYPDIESMHEYAKKVKEKNSGQIEEFPRVAFLCTLIKREVIDKIGGLDERFSPGNYEDDDYCLRAQIAGFKTVIAKDVFIHHYGSKSFTAEGVDNYKNRLETNRKIFVDKWGGTPEEIWLKGKQIKERNIMITLNKNEFIENLERAMSLIEDKDYQAALQLLGNAIETYDQYEHDENDIDLTYLSNLSGNISMLAGDADTAKTYFEKALNLDPASSLACSGLGDVLYVSGNYEAAKTMYEWGLKNDPGNKAASDGLAKVNMQLNSIEKENMSDEAVYRELQNTLGLLEEAYKLFKDNKFRDALHKLTKSEKLLNGQLSNPTDKDFATSFFNLKGSIYLGLNEIDSAKSCFENALNLDPKSSQACAGLGEILYLTEHDEKAKTMFEWAVKNNPDNVFAANGLKKVNNLLGYEDNHSSLDETQTEPDALNLQSTLNEILDSSFELFGMKYFDEAVNTLEKTRELFYSQEDRNLISAYENLKGINFLGLNENDKAKDCFETALSLNPESSQACAGLGECFYLNGKDKEAKTMYEYSVKYNPENQFAVAGLTKVNKVLGLEDNHNSLNENPVKEESAKINSVLNDILESVFELFGLKYFEEAIETLNKSEELFYAQDDLQLKSAFENLKGFNYLGLEDNSKARECFEKSLNVNPASSQACAGLGEIFYLEGKDNEAKIMYEYAVKNNPDNQFAASGLEKVNKVLGLAENDNSMVKGSN